jgi:ATP-dependent DNA helicase RecQ
MKVGPGSEIVQTSLHILNAVFGFSAFRPGQEDIVDLLLSGRNTLCVMPTGAGKSLCYQLPAIIRDGLTVVVSPLVALMDDQVAGLQGNGIAAACIHSNRPRAENVADWRRAQGGEAKILYMSPERLMTERMLGALDRLPLKMIVVDEAHCISKWGASFRPEYEALSGLKDRFPEVTLSAFTATADAATRSDIVAKLFHGDGGVVVQGFDRPNLWLGVAPKTDWRRQLLDFLEPRRGASGIVYCLSRRLTEEVSDFLCREDFRALPYHAGLSPEVRKENQETFMAEDGVVMVATIAFGMGVDKPDIRYVFHLNLPGSVEAYYQEIGRAGRDGEPAEAMMLFGLDDMRMRRQFISQDGDDDDHKRREHHRLDSLLAYCEATGCRRRTLLDYFSEQIEPCGNCDTCQDPPVLIDGTEQACALMQAIVQTGERFGGAHVVDVLRGSSSERIQARGHDNLAAFGAGAAQSKKFWQGFLRQCIAGGFLTIDIEGFGGLKLTRRGRAVLNGEEQFLYREISEGRRSRHKTDRSGDPEISDGDIDIELYSKLKSLRRELAGARNVPAYVVFADAALRDMCLLRPETMDGFAQVNGVGPKKLNDYGEVFLEAIRAHTRAA